MTVKLNRIVSLLLASLLLAGSLTACAADTDPSETRGESPTTAEDTSETELSDDLPEGLYYDGDEIVFISRYREGWSSGELTVPSLNNEPVNDAVYERNRSVEERLGVRITNVEIDTSDYDEVAGKVKLSVQSGTHEYDVMASPVNGAVPIMIDGVLRDLNRLEHLDLDKPWWARGFNETASYNGTQFTATGSMLLSMYRFSFVTLFNQRLFTDANQPFLYEYVENGTWTLDKQISLVPLFHKDNGNGRQDTEGDVYGFLTGSVISMDPYWSSCEVFILSQNEDDGLTMTFDSSKLQAVMDKLLTLCYVTDQATYVYENHDFDGDQIDIRDAFAEGNGAMATLRILELENDIMRGMTDKYGVVPMPKFDEAQKGYRTFLHNQFTVVSVPDTLPESREAEIGAVLEAMASASHRVVRPAYYETTLRTKLAQDPQSAAMMEIIVDHVYMDPGVFYSRELDDFYKYPRTVIQTRKNDIVSHYAGLSKKTNRLLSQLVNKLDKISGGITD